jgi:sugar fermentation stimulation protein A
MKFKQPLEKGIFLKRYKRFFADIKWHGKIITAHVANTGSMKGCAAPNSICYFSVSDDPHRKLKYSLEFIQDPETDALVGVNTSTPNKIEKKVFRHWQSISRIKPEFKYSAQTRFDFLVHIKKQQHLIEVKNVTLKEGDCAFFPDSVTERGQKHLREMMEAIDHGYTCEIVFVIQRSDVKKFKAADDIDSEYASLLKQAVEKGVRVTVAKTHITSEQIEISAEQIKF